VDLDSGQKSQEALRGQDSVVKEGNLRRETTLFNRNFRKLSGDSQVRPYFPKQSDRTRQNDTVNNGDEGEKVGTSFPFEMKLFSRNRHFTLIEPGDDHLDLDLMASVEITSNGFHSLPNHMTATTLSLCARKNAPENSYRDITAAG
jgi:hypothetical protein